MNQKIEHTSPIYVSGDIEPNQKVVMHKCSLVLCTNIVVHVYKTNSFLVGKLDCILKKKKPCVQQRF